MKIKEKPLSVNKCWQGQRFKTKEYKRYEEILLLLLPSMKLKTPPYFVFYRFGVSNKASDADNLVKPLQDILQKKYLFNDSSLLSFFCQKVKVKKGEEFLEFFFDDRGEEELRGILKMKE